MLNDSQRDTLQEIANIGMGQAGESIAKALDAFVELSIPKVLVLKYSELPEAIARGMEDNGVPSQEGYWAVRQAFHGQMRGEAIVLYGKQPCAELADLMGYDEELDVATETELLLDLSNVLVGATLGGIAEQLGADVGFSAPSLMADDIGFQTAPTDEAETPWQSALLVEVTFKLESRSFGSRLIILMPESEVHALGQSLDRFLELL